MAGLPGGRVLLLGILLALLPSRGGDDLMAEADRLRREGTDHLQNTLVPGYDEAAERKAGIAALEKARDLYEKAAAGDASLKVRTEEAIVDINAQLFWARKDTKLDLGGDEEEEKSLEERAREAFEAVETYERRNPSEIFRIMVRYFEVAKRFIGTGESVRAQVKSFDLQNRIIEARKAFVEENPCEQSVDVTAFEDSFRSIPDGDVGCLFYFAGLLEKHWMDEEASRCYERILAGPKGPFTARSRSRLAAAQIRLGRMDAAREILGKGANEGEPASVELLARISSTDFDRLQGALEDAKEKAIGGGKEALKAYRKVAEEMREARGELPILPVEKVCSDITRLAALDSQAPSERGSAPCGRCTVAASASFMTCPTCAGRGQVEKVRIRRVFRGGRIVREKETYLDRCGECHGNKRVVCRSCAGFTSVLGGMTRREQKAMQGLKDEVWGKELLVKADLETAVQKVERYVVKKKMSFLADLDAPFIRSEDLRTAIGAPPLAGRLVPGEADAIWRTIGGEEKFNFLLSWCVEFSRTLAAVSFLDDAKAEKAISRGGPEDAPPEAISPEEAGAFPDDLAGGFIRIRGKVLGSGEDPDNPYLLGIDLASRFPHGVDFYVWKGEARPLLEGLAGSYKLDYLKDLVAAYDFSAEQKVRLAKPGSLVTVVGRIIPAPSPLFEVWKVEP